MLRSVFFILLVLLACLIGCDCADDDDDNDDAVDDDASPPTYCVIDDVVHGAEQTHPRNPCLICDPARDQNAWSFNDAASCEDGLFCNGADSCLAGACQVHHDNPCPDNGLFCDGVEVCVEAEDRCGATDVPQCLDDLLWCNGEEFCDEDNDQCGRRVVPECPDDGLYCNGGEFCDESADACAHEGDPCLASGTWCQEDDDSCRPIDCAAVAAASIEVCGRTLDDIDGTPQDAAGLQAWCEMSEALFAVGTEMASPFWNCWSECIFAGACGNTCFVDCLAPPDPGPGCEEIVHEIYRCGGYATYDYWSRFFIPELDLVDACNRLDRDWECYWDCVQPFACDAPPTPPQTQYATACVVDCDPNPAVEFDGANQCAQVAYDPAFDAPQFTVEMWVRIDQPPAPGASYTLAGRLLHDPDADADVAGWEIGVLNADFDFYTVDMFYFSYADATGSVLIDVPEPLMMPGYWRHIALQYTGYEFAFFLDGRRRDREAFGGPLVYDAVGLGIGCPAQGQADGGPARALIDELRLLDMALHGYEHFTPQYENGVTPATIGLWHMDEPDGATLVDEGPLGLDGVLAEPDLRGWRVAKNRWSPVNVAVYNNSAQSAGYNARIAQELYYQDGGSYCDNLEGLLEWDRNLTDDPEVTFQFGTCNGTGYTYITRHNRGDEVYTLHD